MHRPKLLVVSGGRAGVGTTTIAVNLAVVLAHQRRRTLLADAAPPGGGAVLSRVEEGDALADAVPGRRTVGDALQSGPEGLIKVLPAAWALGKDSEAPGAARSRLVGELRGLGSEVEFVVVDAGNGVGPLVRPLWGAADMVLLVTTPEPASVMDAYASIKLLASDRGAVPTASLPIHTLVNKSPHRSVARQVHTRLSQACLRFLGIEVEGVGFVADDPRVPAADRAGKPVVICTPRCRSARGIRALGKTVLQRTRQSAVTT
ncbi:MAG TPA: hypothetical protein VMY37_15295 [Thermoguttaceae bacterium]|nr:hypothetical protein [Thermoguttaceae bacterium]